MFAGPPETLRPGSAAEVAEALASAAAAGAPVRIRGGGTKQDWGGAAAPGVALCTTSLDGPLEHHAGDLTAVLGAGVPLASAQEAFAARGQRLALDPPDPEGAATIGGVVACADSGPARHRHGAARDLVLGAAIALPDGTVARTGSRVIKNVAGYDLAKLYAGSLGTLGVLTELTVRLHPLPERTLTVLARGSGAALASGARALGGAPLELDALDVRLDPRSGEGSVLARAAGRTAGEVAARASGLLARAGLEPEPPIEDDEPVWEAQRAGQRPREPGGAVVRVSARPSRVGAVLEAAAAAGAEALVGRAGPGIAWLRFAAGAPLSDGLRSVRAALPDAAVVVQQAPAAARAEVDVWGPVDPGALAVMRRLKARFDPAGACNPGLVAGGI